MNKKWKSTILTAFVCAGLTFSAAAIGAKPSEIYFTSGGTEANNWAILGYAHANPGKRHIITTEMRRICKISNVSYVNFNFSIFNC